MSTSLLQAVIALAAAIGLGPASYALACVAPLPRPTHGARGLRRARALATAFGVIEPLVRWLAALLAKLPAAPLRTRSQRSIVEAGDLLGLDADELFALCVLGATAGALFGLGGRALGAWSSLPALGLLLGASLPWVALHEARKTRMRVIARRLPSAIDLMALCMDAGLDFAGALELVARELTHPDEPLGEELHRLLQELATGRTRRQALAAFALRVPSPAVSDFAAAVAQADQKGNPLAETLEVQAQMLRMRRSVVAEEAAARASVLLILPVVVLMSAILLVLFGPFIVRGVKLS